MLYVTTRNGKDAFTVQHVLTADRGADGGLYVPLRFPKLSESDLQKLRERSFNQRVSAMLNLFLTKKLSGWDLDFSVGRYPVRLNELPHRMLMGEFWHNPQWSYDYLERKIQELLPEHSENKNSWLRVAVRMAIVAAALFECREVPDDGIDTAVPMKDFTLLESVLYLRKMGFPVGNIICCCSEQDQLWDLVCLGQMKTEGTLPENLERIIFECGGSREVERYLSCCISDETYSASDEMLQELRKGLFVSVVSDSRMENAIPNVFRTHRYVLQPDSARAYCGLMDYRAKTGISRPALIVCDESPACSAEDIADRLELSKEALLKII